MQSAKWSTERCVVLLFLPQDDMCVLNRSLGTQLLIYKHCERILGLQLVLCTNSVGNVLSAVLKRVVTTRIDYHSSKSSMRQIHTDIIYFMLTVNCSSFSPRNKLSI